MKWIFILLFLSNSAIGQNKEAAYSYHKILKENLIQQIGETREPHPEYYKYRSKYKVDCQIKLADTKEHILLNTYDGDVKTLRRYGLAAFKLKNQSITLNLYQELPSMRNPLNQKYLLIPFKDLTNQISTYGGGRYIQATVDSIKNGRLLLDFNLSYTPWCAFDDSFICPLPPKENYITTKIKSGEKHPN